MKRKEKEKKIMIPLNILSKKSTKDPFENTIGIGKSGIKDGSIKHDHYLYGKIRKELLLKFGKYINNSLESKGVKEEEILEDFKIFKKSRRRR